jgi:probable phosphomutase (TIGR03848 family)
MTASITYLLLIRHGENDWVGTNRLAGRTNGVHLNDKGRAQSARLTELLKDLPISAIYSSPLERCLQTAAPVAAALGQPVIEEAGILEVDYGEWQGGDLKELSKLPEWHSVQHYPSSFRFPGGETLYQTQSRAVWAIERIVQNHPNQLVALFSHGDVIRTALAHFMGTPLDLFQRIHISTASISALAFHNGRPMVLFTNYTAELPKFEWKQEESSPQEAAPADGEKDALNAGQVDTQPAAD